ncbi:MAG: aminopeptidase P family protein, partial [Chloroflexi bacterium]|nr:aminopeptidase P family protein [Chloroflexota bacterium]
MTVARSGTPTAEQMAAWLEADRVARPQRLARLRERMARAGVDAYFGVRRENARYLTGLVLGEGEEKVAGQSGWFLISRDEVVVFVDSRYRVQAHEECPEARVEEVYHDLFQRWADLLASLRPVHGRGGGDGVGTGDRVSRLAAESGAVSHATWNGLAGAEPNVELVPINGWVEELRATKEPAEVERIAAACAVADAALERLLPEVQVGVTEAELALRLEWEMRTHGAEALAFDVACLSGPRAALPHGSPGSRGVAAGEVLLFDFGAQVAG